MFVLAVSILRFFSWLVLEMILFVLFICTYLGSF